MGDISYFVEPVPNFELKGPIAHHDIYLQVRFLRIVEFSVSLTRRRANLIGGVIYRMKGFIWLALLLAIAGGAVASSVAGDTGKVHRD